MINISGLIIFLCTCMCLRVIIHFKDQQPSAVKHLTFICINANEACITVRYSKTSNQYGLITSFFFSVFIGITLMMTKSRRVMVWMQV